MQDRLPTLAERVESTAAGYAAEPGTIAYQFAAQREQIAAGVLTASEPATWVQQGDYAVQVRS